MKRFLFLVVMCLLVWTPQSFGQGASSAVIEEPTWEILSLPDIDSKKVSVNDLAVDASNTLWLTVGIATFCWDGDRFREVESLAYNSLTKQLCSSMEDRRHQHWTAQALVPKFFGGADRGLYLSQINQADSLKGRLFKLEQGESVFITEFMHEVRDNRPLVYVSKDGRIFNWGQRFVAFYDGGKWNRMEALLDRRDTLVFDEVQTVHFYFDGNLYSIDKDGGFEHKTIPCTFERENVSLVLGSLLGKDKALLVNWSRGDLFAFDLGTGEPVNIETSVPQCRYPRFHGCFGTSDGSVWVQTSGRKEDISHFSYFVKITADGRLDSLEETDALRWDGNWRMRVPGSSKSILNASDGSIWLDTDGYGIGVYRGGHLTIYGNDFGYQGGSFVEDNKGNIYVLHPDGIVVCREGAPPALAQPLMAHCEEFALCWPSPIRDSRGNVWFRSKDEQPKVSRWNGKEWTHSPVPFRTGLSSDDRQKPLRG